LGSFFAIDESDAGNYLWEFFALKVALETYRFSQIKIQDCDCCIQHHLAQFESRAEVINSSQNLKSQLHRVCGVDLTKIPGINILKPDAAGIHCGAEEHYIAVPPDGVSAGEPTVRWFSAFTEGLDAAES
jgi:hypothetical protein